MLNNLFNRLRGGIHPPDQKQMSAEQPITLMPFADRLILPLSQHIGTPAHPVVKVGDKVLGGQLLAEPDGHFSLPVHAPTSGVVIAFEDHRVPHPSNLTAPCLILAVDGDHLTLEQEGFDNFEQVSKQELLNKIRGCGIAGMGGAGFPTDAKLKPRSNKAIEALIINGMECEPYITADDRLMREHADDVVTGARILAYLLDYPKRCVIAVEDNKPEAVAMLRLAAAGSQVEVAEFPTKYPSGSEKQLIQLVTGKKLPTGKLPSDIGVMVQNITTTVGVYRAIIQGKPMGARVTTVTGKAIARPGNYKVLMGTPVAHLLKETGYDESKSSRLILGGPMMGFTITDAQVPIIKTSKCVLAPSLEEFPDPPVPQACIRCGKCAQVCPMQLLPQQLYWYARSRDQEKLQRYHLFDCIECGSCAYACTSNIPLVHYFRAAKGDIRTRQQQQQAAASAKLRHEKRVARKEALQAERDAKRKPRPKPDQAMDKNTEPGKIIASTTETIES